MTAMFSALLRRLPGTLAVLAVLTLLAVAPPVWAQQVFRVTTIPEEAATEQLR